MLNQNLAIAAFVAFVAATIYIFVGSRVTPRGLTGHTAQALSVFATWWYALAASTIVTGFIDLFGAFGKINLLALKWLTQLNLLIICVALWGLLYYLLYLFTGRPGLLLPLSVFYFAYYLLLVFYITFSKPIDYEIHRWNVDLIYEEPLQGPLFLLVLLLLILPQILGSLALFSLYFRTEHRSQKYRIALVSWSIIVWFGSALVASLGGLGQEDWWQLTSRLLGLSAALVTLMAYRPPRWIRKRYGIMPIGAAAPV